MRRIRLIVSVLALCAATPFWTGADQPAPRLSILADPPEWRLLTRFDFALTREEFEQAVLGLYSRDGAFLAHCDLSDRAVTVHRTPERNDPLVTIRFAADSLELIRQPYPFAGRIGRDLLGWRHDRPLEGLVISLDPGHIGGEWAKVEERHFTIGRTPPVREADLNLLVCRHLAPQLEAAGARVVWTKDGVEPVTHLRPGDLVPEATQLFARQRAKDLPRMTTARLAKTLDWYGDLLFYRVAEIIARAHRTNRELRPDLTLCIHFNAAPWPPSGRPRLYKANKLVLFVHGSYTADELTLEDQKYRLLEKLFEQSAATEQAVAEAIAREFARGWGWPPENYDGSSTAHRVGGNPYVWSRNLLANRLFNGPTVFVEGPYMNDRDIHARLIAGDYDGEKLINQTSVRSIFREYADWVARGVINHYRLARELHPEEVRP